MSTPSHTDSHSQPFVSGFISGSLTPPPLLSTTPRRPDPLYLDTYLSKTLFILIHFGLLLSGIIILVEQYSQITGCESHFRLWGISITLVYGLLTLASYLRWTWFITQVPRDRAICLVVSSVIPCLIAIVGGYDVLQVPEGCHLQNISHLYGWSLAVVIFNSLLTLLLWSASFCLCRKPDRFRANTALLHLADDGIPDAAYL